MVYGGPQIHVKNCEFRVPGLAEMDNIHERSITGIRRLHRQRRLGCSQKYVLFSQTEINGIFTANSNGSRSARAIKCAESD